MTTPVDLLALPVLSINHTAIVLHLFRRNGEPNRRAVHELVRSGALRLVDPTQNIHRWTVSSAEVRRYIAEGPAS